MNRFRAIRLASRILRIAALEDRIQHQIENSKVPEEDIRKLATLDPTEGKYLGWLVRQYGTFSHLMSDMNSVMMQDIKKMLGFYDKAKESSAHLDHMGLSSDISQISLDVLYLAWLKNRNVDLASEREKIKKAKNLATKVIYDKKGYKIIKIQGQYSPLAACMYAKGTKWCTSDEGKAESYLRRGPLYVLFKDGQKILQTDLKEWKDLTNQEIDIMKNDELSQVLVDSGLLSDPQTILWGMAHKYFAGAPRWPAVEPILAKDPKSAYEYAMRTGEQFKLGESAIASNPEMAVMYAVTFLHGRFPEAEETIKTSPDWWKTYNNYIEHLWKDKEQKQGVSGSRSLRLAYRLLRIAGLEERIQHYVKERGISEADLRRLAQADPTNGKYLGWLIKNIADPKDISEYWLDTVRQVLTFYQEASRSKVLLEHLGLPGDINKLNLDQIYRSWVDHRDDDLKSRAKAAKKAKSTAKVIYSKGPYKVLQIGGEGVDPEKAIEAACGYSQGSAWCTRTHNTAKGYLERGPLFLAFNGKERLFLANYRGSEIKDVSNNPVKFTDETLFLLLESGLLQLWASNEYTPENTDKIFDYLVYHLDVRPYQHPEFLQYMMNNGLVSQKRMARYVEILGKRLPNVESYIATDPRAALLYAKYVLDEPWSEGEPAIRSVPEYWQDYQKRFKEEFAHV